MRGQHIQSLCRCRLVCYRSIWRQCLPPSSDCSQGKTRRIIYSVSSRCHHLHIFIITQTFTLVVQPNSVELISEPCLKPLLRRAAKRLIKSAWSKCECVNIYIEMQIWLRSHVQKMSYSDWWINYAFWFRDFFCSCKPCMDTCTECWVVLCEMGLARA